MCHSLEPLARSRIIQFTLYSSCGGVTEASPPTCAGVRGPALLQEGHAQRRNSARKNKPIQKFSRRISSPRKWGVEDVRQNKQKKEIIRKKIILKKVVCVSLDAPVVAGMRGKVMKIIRSAGVERRGRARPPFSPRLRAEGPPGAPLPARGCAPAAVHGLSPAGGGRRAPPAAAVPSAMSRCPGGAGKDGPPAAASRPAAP